MRRISRAQIIGLGGAALLFFWRGGIPSKIPLKFLLLSGVALAVILYDLFMGGGNSIRSRIERWASSEGYLLLDWGYPKSSEKREPDGFIFQQQWKQGHLIEYVIQVQDQSSGERRTGNLVFDEREFPAQKIEIRIHWD